jgi:hypothetical protein
MWHHRIPTAVAVQDALQLDLEIKDDWRLRAAYMWAFGIALCVVGCSQSGNDLDSYKQTVRSARAALPEAREIESVFPVTTHSITHYGLTDSPTTVWNTNAYFGERYWLGMRTDVRVDYDAHTVTPVGASRFYLIEIATVEKSPDGRVGTTMNTAAQREFALADWRKLLASGGDLSAIGVTVNKAPVEGWDAYVQAACRNIINVPLNSTEPE